MKVLLLNGSPHEKGCTYTALSIVAESLNKNDVETEIVHLGKGDIPGCTACASCSKTGKCIYNDKVNELLERCDEFDGIVVGSPVYYAGPSGQITAFLDRFFYASGGRWSHKPAASVVSCRRGGATAAFDRLNKYFTISNMPIVSSNYWNQVHGAKAEDVLKDEEGTQTMRILGENMAWLLKCIEQSGIKPPVLEAKIKTNYIR